MRDIRSDLQERLKATEQEAEKVKVKLELLRKLLEFENESMNKVASEAPPLQPPPIVTPPNENVAPNHLAKMIGLRRVV